MNFFRKFNLTLFTSLTIAVVFILIFSAITQISTDDLIIGGIIVFLISFLFVRTFNAAFIYRKINAISTSIRQSRNQNPLTGNKQMDILTELENEITALSNERKEEAERLEQLETYRKEFLGNVSHELKTPIFNIQGYIHTLLDGAINDPSVNRDYLQRTEKSVDRMITIIEDLQTITQLEKGELILDEEPFDLRELSRDVIHSQEMNAKANSISLELSPDTQQKIMVLADRFRIRQVLVNLVVNSIRYGKPGGRTAVKISDAGEKVIVEVSDNGLGISQQHLPRIFERFYRIDKSRSRELGGSGLGLSIVKHIIEAHHQTIDVLSTENVGSVFSFSLKKV